VLLKSEDEVQRAMLLSSRNRGKEIQKSFDANINLALRQMCSLAEEKAQKVHILKQL
jgi:hypothetical protein